MGDRAAVSDSEANSPLRRQFERVYAELKDIAHRQLAGSPARTLNTTGLVHEAYLRLLRTDFDEIRDRGHFFAIAARAMRYIVIDHARERFAEKRGGSNAVLVEIDQALDVASGAMMPEDLLRLDEAQFDESGQTRFVELRFFSGLSMEEIAAIQSVSERTLNRDWRRARAQLYATLYPES